MFKFKDYRGKYYSKDSCKFLLQYHLIFVCKYRKKLLVGSLNDDMISKMLEISERYDFEIRKHNIHLEKIRSILEQTFLERTYFLVRWIFRFNYWRCFSRNFEKVY